jgi:hypothetical protein
MRSRGTNAWRVGLLAMPTQALLVVLVVGGLVPATATARCATTAPAWQPRIAAAVGYARTRGGDIAFAVRTREPAPARSAIRSRCSCTAAGACRPAIMTLADGTHRFGTETLLGVASRVLHDLPRYRA